NILLSVPADMTAGKTSPGVRGAHSVDSAFRVLLANTGLEAVRRAEGGYALRPAPATSATTLPAVVVSGASASVLPEAYAGGEVARGARVG
ncbi:STN domain-containing protein, partial [Campylobacter lari]|nr:STN domain-containing protein [Campylobacter lari]